MIRHAQRGSHHAESAADHSEGFDNEFVKTVMQLMIPPDGKTAGFTITHEGNARGARSAEHVEAVPHAADSALKGTLVEGEQTVVFSFREYPCRGRRRNVEDNIFRRW